MDSIATPSFVAAVAFSAVALFLISLIPVFAAQAVIDRLNLQGKRKQASSGEGLKRLDKALFWFRKRCDEGYYMLFMGVLIFSVMLSTGPWICRSVEEEYSGYWPGMPSHERAALLRMMYEVLGPQNYIIAFKVIYVCIAVVAVTTIVRTFRKIRRGHQFESDDF